MPTIETLATRYEAAPDWNTYLNATVKNHDLWTAVDRHVELTPQVIDRARKVTSLAGIRHVLILSEDWCGDAVNIVPWVARLVERLPEVDLRVFGRDANPDLMNSHLTGSSQSVPVVLLLDAGFRELGWWGPRPTALQTWVIEEGLALPKEERYLEVRKWYARDKGQSILGELIGLMETAATA